VRKKKINSTADSGSSRNPRERVSHWMALVNRVVAVTPPKLELSWRSQSHEDVDMHQSFDTSENDDMSVDSAGSSPRGLLEVSSPPGHAR